VRQGQVNPPLSSVECHQRPLFASIVLSDNLRVLARGLALALKHNAEGISLNRGSAIAGPDPAKTAWGTNHSLFLDSFRRQKEPVTCIGHGRFYSHQVPDGKSHGWLIAEDCCGKVECRNPHCVARYTKERKKRVLRIFDGLSQVVGQPVRVGCLVFTMPRHLRTADKSKLSLLRKRAREIAAAWLLSVNKLDAGTRHKPAWRIAGVDCYHPEGDKEPGVWKPHIHMQIPMWAYSGHHDSCNCGYCKGKRWHRLRVRVTRADLSELRRLWGLVLIDVLGWSPPCGDSSRCSVDYSYISPLLADRFHHRIRYDFRHWSDYSAPWRAIRWWGYLSPKSKQAFGLIPPQKIEYDAHPAGFCPLCGAKAQLVLSLDKETLNHTQKNRRTILERSGAPPWAACCEMVRPLPKVVTTWTD